MEAAPPGGSNWVQDPCPTPSTRSPQPRDPGPQLHAHYPDPPRPSQERSGGRGDKGPIVQMELATPPPDRDYAAPQPAHGGSPPVNYPPREPGIQAAWGARERGLGWERNEPGSTWLSGRQVPGVRLPPRRRAEEFGAPPPLRRAPIQAGVLKIPLESRAPARKPPPKPQMLRGEALRAREAGPAPLGYAAQLVAAAHHLPAAMGSHQDFRSLQAKFQVSQSQPSDLPPKPPKPEFNKLQKKFLSPEFPEFPKKPCKLEVSGVSKKSLQPEARETKQPSQPEPPALDQKPPQPQLNHPAKPPSEPRPGVLPKKFQHPGASQRPSPAESSTFPKKPPQPQSGGLIRKSLPQPEFSQGSPLSPLKPGPCEPYPNSPQSDFSTSPRKSPQPQASGPPKKFLLQSESSEVPLTPPWKPETSDSQSHAPQQGGFSMFPKKPPQPQPSDLPRKPPHQPEFGDLARTSSEPQVSVIPKRSQQLELKVLPKKLPQAGGSGLPRTSSEPEFSSLPRKFPHPEHQGSPRKFSQPEPNAGVKKPPTQSEPFKGFPRKPPLPGWVSESSLPAAMAGSSPGSGLAGTPHWRSEDLRAQHLPRRRPLPPASSLGSPPVKPPLPPGPLNIQSFRRLSAAGTAGRTTRSSVGTQAQQPKNTPQDPDEIYELYDNVESTDDPGPRGRDKVVSTHPATKRPLQEPELRKEKAPPSQQLPSMDPKQLKQIRKAEKAEREFRKKFKFEGEIVIHTRMMIDPNAKTRRGGGKHLGIRRGEILEVIEFTNKEEMLCRDPKGKYGYVPRTALLPLETEVYDDVGFWDPLDNQPFPRAQ
ncbi:PREDICTED: PML-RARA-regulated adapter molecule 1 [Dipodomys ordii]|uniref:PML-RARA-regulated adapter molecule 1 n=1 Tax=Dipodomys ordii TaxID=10020 RepID=A0A1S3GJB7_DIPOR|nr:PREDICTED: PML-RARA-regulated adapter molecule 1 [Dipodomys ordii]